MSHFIFDMFKRWCLCANKKWKPEYMRHRRLKGYVIFSNSRLVVHKDDIVYSGSTGLSHILFHDVQIIFTIRAWFSVSDQLNPDDICLALLQMNVQEITRGVYNAAARDPHISHVFICGHYVTSELVKSEITLNWLKKRVKDKIYAKDVSWCLATLRRIVCFLCR